MFDSRVISVCQHIKVIACNPISYSLLAIQFEQCFCFENTWFSNRQLNIEAYEGYINTDIWYAFWKLAIQLDSLRHYFLLLF